VACEEVRADGKGEHREWRAEDRERGVRNENTRRIPVGEHEQTRAATEQRAASTEENRNATRWGY